ncbi:unnamed protein product, partial [Ectocarpus fasciculatus]
NRWRHHSTAIFFFPRDSSLQIQLRIPSHVIFPFPHSVPLTPRPLVSRLPTPILCLAFCPSPLTLTLTLTRTRTLWRPISSPHLSSRKSSCNVNSSSGFSSSLPLSLPPTTPLQAFLIPSSALPDHHRSFPPLTSFRFSHVLHLSNLSSF